MAHWVASVNKVDIASLFKLATLTLLAISACDGSWVPRLVTVLGNMALLPSKTS